MDFLTEACEIFDNKVALAQVEFMEALTTFTESCFDEEQIFTEKKKEKESLMIRTKKFFANLIAAFQNFKATIQVELDRKVRASEFENKLRKLHKELKEGQKNGIKYVEVHDIWTMRDKYLSCVDELKKYARKFAEMKYTKTGQIDDDISSFNTIMERYKKDLEDASKKMITVPLTKMLDFVEDEVSGRSKVMDTLNDAITILQQMDKDCELIEKRKDILGPDIIPKHVGFLRKIAYSISGFFKRWAVKIITTIVFIVG